MITKVMKFELRYVDGCGEFQDFQNNLWNLQRNTREILNKTVLAFHVWSQSDYSMVKEIETGIRILEKTPAKDLENSVYHQMTAAYPEMSSANVNQTIQVAKKKFNGSSKDVFVGNMTLPSYKKDQPLQVHDFKIIHDGTDWHFIPTLFSNRFKSENGIKTNPRFKLLAKDGTQKAILERIENGVYKKGQSQILYDRKKWFLSLVYSLPPAQHLLDPDKILGVDLGVVYALYASSKDAFCRLSISGDEIQEFDNRMKARVRTTQGQKDVLEYADELEARRKSKQKQARYCGEGRIGHGTKTRVAPVYAEQDLLANHRDTINHRYSKALIDFAVKNGFGTIQMEDLTNIKQDNEFPKRLRHWTYFDLQTKIISKAQEHGITVVKVNPACTSQRCSKCGYIDPLNRVSQADFHCTACGFTTNADFNASQNLSIRNIDKIIAKERKENTPREPF